MADKRMFNKKITKSDAFRDMPVSAQNLYFHLNMDADDDGFVNSPKQIMTAVKASVDDLKLLIAKRFVIGFESGVIVIKHWRMHNTLRKDRYHPTDYQEELAMLGIKENGSYSEMPKLPNENVATTWQPHGNHMATEIRLDKNRLDKISIDIENNEEENNIYNNARARLIDTFTNELKRPLSSVEMEFLFSLRENYSDDLIILALSEAVLNNARSFRYIERILQNWKGAGITTVDEARVQIDRFNGRKQIKSNESYEDMKKEYITLRDSIETIDAAATIRQKYFEETGRDIEDDIHDK
ncbi:MAG: DnaD domain protein [Erysipelotrichaceae bacterium]|nr:DnaD domain protein [Erysipelotrichaceae bacterium]